MLTGITGLLYDLTRKLANVAPTTVPGIKKPDRKPTKKEEVVCVVKN